MRSIDVTLQEIRTHFTARADHYDQSSHWCTDEHLVALVTAVTKPAPADVVLEVGCGTGLLARAFHGRVARMVGIDITPAMYRLGRPHLDHLVATPGERLPFRDGVFDVAVERQGIQFMDARLAVAEMARVTRPGGRVCLVQLCAIDGDDQEEYFEILRLRNPARRNFFLAGDLESMLRDAGCREVTVHDYLTTEDVGCWADNGAIGATAQTAIAEIYRHASPRFKERHQVELTPAGRILDHMRFGVAIGVR